MPRLPRSGLKFHAAPDAAWPFEFDFLHGCQPAHCLPTDRSQITFHRVIWEVQRYLVNKRLGVVDPAGVVTLPSPLDTPNNPGSGDCQTAAQ